MKSFLCDFMKANYDWAERLKNINIRVKIDNKRHLCILNYLPNADFANPLAREARGIIIDLDTFTPVCWGFNKFGNYTESYADNIDWTSARVQEKLDGSIIKMFYFDGMWNFATNSCMDAWAASLNETMSFGDLITKAGVFVDTKVLDKDCTYIFELVSPYNTVVVEYPKVKMYHIGTRNNVTGEELEVDIGVDKPKCYDLNNMAACLDFVRELPPEQFEGFVVVDKDWHRVKVKSEAYFLAHKLRTGTVSLEAKLAAVLDGTWEKMLEDRPELDDDFKSILDTMELHKASINAFVIGIRAKYEEGMDRKSYALKYGGSPLFRFGLEVYSGKRVELDLKYWLKYFKLNR